MYAPRRLVDIASIDEVWLYLEGPFLDATAPSHTYSDQPIVYDRPISGNLGHNSLSFFVTPIRFHQTRSPSGGPCPPGGLPSYPAGEPSYPRCIASSWKEPPSVEPFGYNATDPSSPLATAGFTYVSDAEAAATQNPISSSQRSGISSQGANYGPGGFIRDVWRANEYRSTIAELKAGRWIDEYTRSAAVILQTYNAQSSCLSFTTILFEFGEGSGKVSAQVQLLQRCIDHHPLRTDPTLSFGTEGTHFEFEGLNNYKYVVFGVTCIYAIRSVFVQAKILRFNWRRLKKDLPLRFGGVNYLMELGLTVVMCYAVSLWAIDTEYEENLVHEVTKGMFNAANGAPMREFIYGRLALLEHTPMMRAAKPAWGDGVVSSDMAMSEWEYANHLLNYGRAWGAEVTFGQKYNITQHADGSPSSFSYDFAADVNPPFRDFRFLGVSAIQNRGIWGFLAFLCIAKLLRYFQAWRPLADRYGAIFRMIPNFLSYFIVLLQLMLTFAALGQQVCARPTPAADL